MPKVSIIIPAFNCERFIGEAIDSVLAQTYTDFELIVVDDGSEDQTAQKVKQYGEKLTYLYQPNSGQAKARNLGYAHSNGEYLAFLDADDRWYPQMLEVEVQALDSNPQMGLVYSDVDVIAIRAAGGKARDPPRPEHEVHPGSAQEHYLARRAGKKRASYSIIGFHSIPFPSASLKRRVIFEKAGCFDVSFYQGGEDVVLWAKMYRLANFLWIPQSLAQRRMQRRQVSHMKERRLEADLMASNKLWTLFAEEPDRQTDLLVTYGRIWSREGQRLVRGGKLKSARECFRRSHRYYPFYIRNYIRWIRSYFHRSAE